MADVSAYVLGNFRGGIQDRDVTRLPFSYCRNITNMYVDRGSLKSRGGYAKRHVTALESGSPIQFMHPYLDLSGNWHIIVACNGKLFRDDLDGDGPNGNDITGGLTLSNSNDARFDFDTFDGMVFGTDGVNEPFYIADASSNAKVISQYPGAARKMPGRANVLRPFKQQLFLGNYKNLEDVEFPFGVIHSNPIKRNQLEFSATSGAANELNRGFPVRGLAKHTDDVLLILLERGIHWAMFDPVVTSGAARTNFRYDELSPRVGLSGQYCMAVTPEGTFFLDKRGNTWIPPGSPPPKPQYVGKAVEKFWSLVNKARLPYACSGEDYERNGVLYCVPYGAGQTTNNRGLFFNYESWAEEGLEQNDLHPAYSIFQGNAKAFAFNCFCNIVDSDGRDRLVGGGYDGFLYTMNEGETDGGVESYMSSFTLPYVGDANRENHWYQVILDCDLQNQKTLSVVQRNYDRPITYSQIVQSGTQGALLDEFQLDVDVLAGDSLGPIYADMEVGPSRYTELEFQVLGGFPFAVHGIVVRYTPGSAW